MFIVLSFTTSEDYLYQEAESNDSHSIFANKLGSTYEVHDLLRSKLGISLTHLQQLLLFRFHE